MSELKCTVCGGALRHNNTSGIGQHYSWAECVKYLQSTITDKDAEILRMRELLKEVKSVIEWLDRSLCAYLDYAPNRLEESCYDPNGAHNSANALMEKLKQEGV